MNCARCPVARQCAPRVRVGHEALCELPDEALSIGLISDSRGRGKLGVDASGKREYDPFDERGWGKLI